MFIHNSDRQIFLETELVKLRNVVFHHKIGNDYTIDPSDIKCISESYPVFFEKQSKLKRLYKKLSFYKKRLNALNKTSSLEKLISFFSKNPIKTEIVELEKVVVNLENLIKNYSKEKEQRFFIIENLYQKLYFSLDDYLIEIFSTQETNLDLRKQYSKLVSFFKSQLISKPNKPFIDIRSKLRIQIKNFFKNLNDEADGFTINLLSLKHNLLLEKNFSSNEKYRNSYKIRRT